MNLSKNIKFLYLILIVFITISCNKKQDIFPEKLNGYWEIKKVINKNGEEKDYNFNPVIDFYELKNNIGIRKKVYPKLQGKFETDILADSVFIKNKDNDYFLEIKNSSWKTKETITILNDSILQYISENGMEYQYKRYQKIAL